VTAIFLALSSQRLRLCRSGVGDAGRRRQEPAAGDRRQRGLEQADQEAQGEGGQSGDRGAQVDRHLRGGTVPAVPRRRRPREQGDGGGKVVAVPQQQQQQPDEAVQLHAFGQPVR
jgi:hypothetical protein